MENVGELRRRLVRYNEAVEHMEDQGAISDRVWGDGVLPGEPASLDFVVVAGAIWQGAALGGASGGGGKHGGGKSGKDDGSTGRLLEALWLRLVHSRASPDGEGAGRGDVDDDGTREARELLSAADMNIPGHAAGMGVDVVDANAADIRRRLRARIATDFVVGDVRDERERERAEPER